MQKTSAAFSGYIDYQKVTRSEIVELQLQKRKKENVSKFSVLHSVPVCLVRVKRVAMCLQAIQPLSHVRHQTIMIILF